MSGVTGAEAAMMGRQIGDQASLFYEFRLEDRVPKDHLLRRINVFVAAVLGAVRGQLKSCYSEIGRPSIDPDLMIRMLIIGYCYGLRSERKLTQEVELHLAYRWFCRLDLDDKVPHHSTFSENRLHRTYDEVESTKTMLDRTERRFDLKPKRLAADTAYGAGRFLGWLVGRKIMPHIPVRDASERDDGTFSRSDFRWHRRRGVYICPNNKVLHTTGTVHEGTMLRYRASKFDCDICALKMQCCPKMPARQVPRDVHEDARDVARRLMRTKAFLKSRDERKRVEMRFAHLKIHHGFERMRLRGLSGARDEFHLAAIAQNLKTLALRALGPPRSLPSASFA